MLERHQKGDPNLDPSLDARYLRVVEEDGRRCVTIAPALFGDPMELDLSSHAIGDPQ